MSEERTLECETHGKCRATFICHHLMAGEQLGFHMGHDPEDPDRLYPDAWCERCDEVLQQEGRWNDASEAFADVKVVCSGCYCEIRERNWMQDEAAREKLASSSLEYLQAAQEEFLKAFKINEHERWDWYQETGKLVFSHEGQPVVDCDIHFAGSLSTVSDTWMWAWANESFEERIKSESRRVRELGVESNFLKLACGFWSADEADGWQMTAILARTLDAVGAYRTPNEHGFVYMVVESARWVKPVRRGVFGRFRRS